MGPVTRAVQTGIGLVAELKAAKAEHKSSSSSSSRDISDIPQAQASSSTAEPLDPPPRFSQLQIDEKRPYEVDEESDDDDDDEHFGGGQVPPSPPHYESSAPPELDSEELPPYPGQGELTSTSETEFPEHHKSTTTKPPPRLQYPVIIPQRRPGSKIRGFVRAYAPVLADYDIDQDAFLNFLKTFHKASQV